MFGNFAKIRRTIGATLIWQNFQTLRVLLNKSKIVRTTLHFYLACQNYIPQHKAFEAPYHVQALLEDNSQCQHHILSLN